MYSIVVLFGKFKDRPANQIEKKNQNKFHDARYNDNDRISVNLDNFYLFEVFFASPKSCGT